MADQKSQFEILLKTVADATGITQIKTEIGGLNQGLNTRKGAIVGVAAGATGFLLIDEAVHLAKRGVEELVESVKAAGREQVAVLPIRALVGDLNLAQEKIEQIHNLASE